MKFTVLRRTLCVLLCILFLLSSLLCSCGESPPAEEKDSLTVVTTVFPLYDWTRSIVGEDFSGNLLLLADDGTDMHSFQPSAEDILRISSCDLLIYIGGESEEWVEEVLADGNSSRKVLCLADALSGLLRGEETTEGMQAEEEEEEAFDEHIWMSLANASAAGTAIRQALCEIDPTHAEEYTSQEETWQNSVSALDSRYREMIDGAARNTILVADRFPFLYLTREYSLSYYAAFAGCSAESEAKFETVTFLAEKLSELSLPGVVITETSDGELADAVLSAAGLNLPVVTLNSMQSVTRKDIDAGANYLSIMEDNLEVLTDLLN